MIPTESARRQSPVEARPAGAVGSGPNTMSCGRFALVISMEMLVAVALTVPTLTRTFWRDELFSAYFAQQPLGLLWDIIAGREANMGGYYLLLHAWAELGDSGSEPWLRLPSMLFAIAAIPVTAILARRLFGDRAAVLTGLLMSISAFLIDYAAEARSYALTMLLAAVSGLLLVNAMDRRGVWRWVAYVLGAVAMVISHPLAILVLAAHTVSLLALPPTAERRAPLTAVVAAGAVAVGLPAYVTLAQGEATSWIPATSFRLLGGFVTHYGGGHVPALPWFALAALAVWRLIPDVRRAGRSTETWRIVFLVLWFVVPPVLLVLFSLYEPAFVDRYLVGVFPALAVLVAAGLAAIRHRTRALVAVGVVVAASLVGVAMRIYLTPEPEYPRHAANTVAVCARPGDAIVYTHAWARVPFDYYLERAAAPGRPEDIGVAAGNSAADVRDTYPRERSPGEFERLLADRERVWVIDYPTDDWHPVPDPMLDVERSGFLSRWPSVQAGAFGELRVRLFSLSQAASRPCEGLGGRES